MKNRSKSKLKPRIIFKGVVALSMLMVWLFVVVTGLLMWAAPHGQGLGKESFILGLSRHDIGEIHLILALIAVAFTIIHIVIDWKAFMGLIRYMVQASHRTRFES